MIDSGHWESIESLKCDFLETETPEIRLPWYRHVEFIVYCALAAAIHAAIALPALMTRVITDAVLEKSIITAVKPKKRTDLY